MRLKKLVFWKNKLIRDKINYKKIPAYLFDYGFVKKINFCSGDFQCFNYKKNIVIKHSYLDSKKPSNTILVPTEIIKITPKYSILIQPICNTTKFIPLEIYNKFNGIAFEADITEDNIGVYRNKFVLFDW